VLIWKLMESAGGSRNLLVQIHYGAKVNSRIYELKEYWRLLTASFVHSGLWHLFVNMFVLFHVGGAMENVYTPVAYLLLLIISALSSGIVSYLLNPMVSVGASGMVFGVMGASVVFGFRYKELLPPVYKRYFGVAVMPYLLLCLWLGFTDIRIDNFAHLGGLVAGIICGFLLEPALFKQSGQRFPRMKKRYYITAVSSLLVATAAGAYVASSDPVMVAVATPEGITFVAPDTWEPVPEFWGFEARGNGEEWISAGFLKPDREYQGENSKDAFSDQFLAGLGAAGEIQDLAILGASKVEIGSRTWNKLEIVWTYKEERQRIDVYVTRSDRKLAVIFTGTSLFDYPDYKKLLERLAHSCKLPPSPG